jgi:hypothetical protein
VDEAVQTYRLSRRSVDAADRSIRYTRCDVGMDDPKIAAIEQFFATYAAGDRAGIEAVLADDVAWTIPGHHPCPGPSVAADHDAVENLGIAQERALALGGVDVGAPTDDQMGAAIGEVDVPVLVDRVQVVQASCAAAPTRSPPSTGTTPRVTSPAVSSGLRWEPTWSAGLFQPAHVLRARRWRAPDLGGKVGRC